MVSHLMVPETQDADSAIRQELPPLTVGFGSIGSRMAASVNFNGEVSFRAIEVEYIPSHDMLTPELAAGNHSPAQGVPESPFRAS